MFWIKRGFTSLPHSDSPLLPRQSLPFPLDEGSAKRSNYSESLSQNEELAGYRLTHMGSRAGASTIDGDKLRLGRMAGTMTACAVSMLIRRALMIGVDVRALLLDVRLQAVRVKKGPLQTASAVLIAYQPSGIPRLAESVP